MVPRVYRRYVAIGDSTTEGMDDPDGAGGYRGWADRFAEHVARAQTPAAQAAHAASGEAERAVLGDAGRAAAGDAEPAALGDAERRAGAAERTARVGAERLAGVGAERSARVEAERGAGAQGGLEYANLAIRGRTTARIRAEQLAPALDLAPDLATVVAGMNDILRGSFDLTAVARDIFEMQHALVAQGATVLTFTLPDPAPVMPIARPLRGRVLALNEAIRKTTADSGAILLDLGAYAVASDPRLWSDDRLHANSAGHERIGAALAYTLGLPGFDDSWTAELPPTPLRRRHETIAAELAWIRRHLLPWAGRHLLGRSLGDNRVCKRATPSPVVLIDP
ncbi:SGNH/GDSL hydrolase family protein [Dactylosporangium darangshiense]